MLTSKRMAGDHDTNVRCWSVVGLILAATIVPAAVSAQESETGLHIPEPMVFDLVHSLGVEKGAFEANVLALFPLNDTSDRFIDWAPEIEYAVSDGVAIEFELPFEDSDLHAYKFAAQFTFDRARGSRHISGTQFIVEKIKDDDIWELTALYLRGVQFNQRDSAMMMFGARTEVGGDAGDQDEILINVSLFRELNHRTVIGIENDLGIGLDEDSHLTIFPQVHYEITDTLEIQFGAGAEIDEDNTDFSAGFRFIYATPGGH